MNNELKQIFLLLEKQGELDFFSLKKKLYDRFRIKAEYHTLGCYYLQIEYKGEKYSYASLKNVEPDSNTLILKDGSSKFALGK